MERDTQQRVGPIVRSSRVEVAQAASDAASQVVEAVTDSADVKITQLVALHDRLLRDAAELSNQLVQLSPSQLDDIRAIVIEELGDAVVTAQDATTAKRVVDISGYDDAPLARSLSALGTAASIVSGGIAVNALTDPVGVAVAVPVALALAGAYDQGGVRQLFRRLGRLARRR